MSARSTTRSFYGRWAGLYDRLAVAPGIRLWRRRAVDALDLSSGETVVEMGVGTGANLPLLREQVGPPGRVIGVDLTRPMLDRAAERVARAGWANVHLIQADATQMALTTDVDAVLATFLVGMLPEPGTTVSDWLAMLAPGGRVVLLHGSESPARLLAPLNLAFRGMVRLASPGDADRSSTELAARVDAATTALETGTVEHDRARLAGGFLRLSWGQLPVD